MYMQHLDASGQAAAVNHGVLEDAFWHLARLRPEVIHLGHLRPALGPLPRRGYRFTVPKQLARCWWVSREAQ
ncbi:MAG: hypothetical protein M5R42_01865 [Rhodocyclaceae bacterium]|nr:hypothetical protein [Rhodocyclaceae bacterium]